MNKKVMNGIIILVASIYTFGFLLSVVSLRKNVASELDIEYESDNELEYKTNPMEFDFMQDLHEMTHQKVYADKKWGALQLTEKQIDSMLKVLDETDYTQESFYRKVLLDWKGGNFNNAVDVHNHIWKMQGGTVGKATRLLTTSEEQKYFEQHFHDN